MGHHLATGTLYGMGSHGVIPSNTSRYTSADVGLIHMVGLDLNNLDAVQLAWLEADLARANQRRAATPWIIVMSHFPLFHTHTAANANMSAAHYRGDEKMGEYAVDGSEMKFEPCPDRNTSSAPEPGAACLTIGEFQLQIGESLQPLFRKYGVDLYNAGHVHSYESTWPLCDFLTGALCRDSDGAGLKTYVEPLGTVHITEGNGGVPGVGARFGVGACPKGWEGCRLVGSGGAYGRIAATPTTLTYNRIANNGGTVTDSWTITQHSHGPFPPTPPQPPPPPPSPPGPCSIRIHHTIGCFNDSDWHHGSASGVVLPHYVPGVAGTNLDLEKCAAACYSLGLPVPGVDGGSNCFCGTENDLQTSNAQARGVPKAGCRGTPCKGNAKETTCGGVGKLLAYQYSCDTDA